MALLEDVPAVMPAAVELLWKELMLLLAGESSEQLLVAKGGPA
jgi:hypothetical protein